MSRRFLPRTPWADCCRARSRSAARSALRDLGIERVPIVNVENACASGSTALREAILAIRAGAVDVVLVVGFEKMFVGDREKSLTALESAADLDVIAGLGLQFTAVYALKVQRALTDGRLTEDSLVAVAAKSHANGALNPNAQFQKGVSAEQIRSSPLIAEPLTRMMCSSFTDGAAAVVVARSGLFPARVPVAVRASSLISGYARVADSDPTVAQLCATDAYEEAGIGPGDLDVAEVHDAAAPGELLYYEQLGLCAPGDAPDLLMSGSTAIGGRIPVNPSGGLVARGHATGATGVAQIAELVWQLRGEAAGRQGGTPRMARRRTAEDGTRAIPPRAACTFWSGDRRGTDRRHGSTAVGGPRAPRSEAAGAPGLRVRQLRAAFVAEPVHL